MKNAWLFGAMSLGLLAACSSSTTGTDSSGAGGGDTGSTTTTGATTTSTGAGGGAATSTCPTYDGEVKAILDAYCASCHAAGNPKAALGTYADAVAYAGGVKSEVETGGMPPANATPLPAADKATLLEWLGCGTPEK